MSQLDQVMVKWHTSQGGQCVQSLSPFLWHEATESIATLPLDGMLVHLRFTPSSMCVILIYTPGPGCSKG